MVKEECKMDKPKLSIATWGKYTVVEAGIWCKNTDNKISRKRIIWGKALLRNTPLTTAPREPRQSAHGGWQLQVSLLCYPVQKQAANSLAQVVLLIRGISFYLLLPPLPLSSYHLQFRNTSSNHSNRFCRNSVSWSPLTAFSSWNQHRYAPAFCQLLTEPVGEEQSVGHRAETELSSQLPCTLDTGGGPGEALGPRWGRQAALRQLSTPPPPHPNLESRAPVRSTIAPQLWRREAQPTSPSTPLSPPCPYREGPLRRGRGRAGRGSSPAAGGEGHPAHRPPRRRDGRARPGPGSATAAAAGPPSRRKGCWEGGRRD